MCAEHCIPIILNLCSNPLKQLFNLFLTGTGREVQFLVQICTIRKRQNKISTFFFFFLKTKAKCSQQAYFILLNFFKNFIYLGHCMEQLHVGSQFPDLDLTPDLNLTPGPEFFPFGITTSSGIYGGGMGKKTCFSKLHCNCIHCQG